MEKKAGELSFRTMEAGMGHLMLDSPAPARLTASLPTLLRVTRLAPLRPALPHLTLRASLAHRPQPAYRNPPPTSIVPLGLLRFYSSMNLHAPPR